jgi:hypothetical protein
VLPRYVSVGYAILAVLSGTIRIKNWVGIVTAVVAIDLFSAAFVGAAALLHFCNSATFTSSPALWFVVLTVAGYAFAEVERLPLAMAQPIRIVVFTLLLLGTLERSVGQVMFLFLALPIPICSPKSQPGDKLPEQPEPQDVLRHEEKRGETEKPRKKPKKTASKKFSHVISAFVKGVIAWGMSIIIIPLQVLPFCYSHCLVYWISASSVSQNPSFLSDLTPMFIIALNSVFIFLYAGQFREPESHDRRKSPSRWMRYMKHFVTFLVVSVLLAVSPRLWWPDSTIAGVESCFIYENGTSVTSFVALGGAGVIKSIERRPPIKLVQD